MCPEYLLQVQTKVLIRMHLNMLFGPGWRRTTGLIKLRGQICKKHIWDVSIKLLRCLDVQCFLSHFSKAASRSSEMIDWVLALLKGKCPDERIRTNV